MSADNFVQDSSQVDHVPLSLSPGEVDELWQFVHGDIMEPGIRDRLCRSMGLCARHTWAYAQVEIELWQQGAGRKHGHQPFDVSVLYGDLLAEAVHRLTATHLPWHRAPAWSLRASAACWICASLEGEREAPVAHHGFAGLNIDALTDEANAGTHTAAWLTQTRHQWRPRVCPACDLDGASGRLLCRPHLMQEARLDPVQQHHVVAGLRRLQSQLQALTNSMTDSGDSASPEVEASWVQALAWFTGWPRGFLDDRRLN